jgi:hypothetical protein
MVEGPLPVANYRATVRLSPAAGAQHTLAEINLRVRLLRGRGETDLVAFFGKTYHDAFDLLKQHFRKA